ncbi:MAG: transcriptional regulator [Alcanivorax sp.]|nr:transcriptional regulator [Alcanivorax sp.]
MNEKADFAKRLKAALIAEGYEPRPSVVEQNFNLRYWGRPVTFQAVRRWLRGESIPEQDKLMVLADWLGVDPSTLRYGSPSSMSDVMAKYGYGNDSISADDLFMIKALLSLSPDRKEILKEVIQAFLDAERVARKRKQ